MRTKVARRALVARREDGNITVITIGFLSVIGLLTVVVVNASAMFLAHRELANVADSIALSAVDVVDDSYYQSNNTGTELRVDEAQARSEASRRLDAETTFQLTVTGNEVVVRLERPVDLWVVPGMRPQSRVATEARAQLTLLSPASIAP